MRNQRVIDAITQELDRTGTQKQQLAARAGLTPESVSRILNGKTPILTKGGQAVLDAIGLSLTAEQKE